MASAFTPEDDAAHFNQVAREMDPPPALRALPARPVLPARGGDYRVSLALQDLHAAECTLATLEAGALATDGDVDDEVVRYRSLVARARRDVARRREALRAARMRVYITRMEWLRRPDREEQQPKPLPVKPVQLALFADASPTPPRPKRQPKKPAPLQLAPTPVVDELPEVSPDDVLLVEDGEAVPWAEPGDVLEVAA